MVNTTANLHTELEELLAESIASAKHREESTFDRVRAEFGNRMVLSGAGNLGRKVLRALRSEGIEPLAFVDNNAALWGTLVDGIPVLSQEDGARRYGMSATFCVTIWRGEGTDTMAERCQPLIDLGCQKVINFGPIFWRFSTALLPHYSLDLPHKVLLSAGQVLAAFDLWHDDASRAEYVAQVRWRLHLDFDNLPLPVAQKIYFPSDLFEVTDEEVFVDCGAYDGDTIEDFLEVSAGRFRRIYAFEADAENFEKLNAYLDSLPLDVRRRITPISKALGERAGTVRFSATGTAAAAISSEGTDVVCVSLDGEVEDQPTCIKMDIEGSEPAALRGAKMAISRWAPLMCVCVYHSQDHLWSIPLQIAANHDGYHFFLRPHLRESWDLVCYAIPAARLLT
jgi:FkbM family methyltransferase